MVYIVTFMVIIMAVYCGHVMNHHKKMFFCYQFTVISFTKFIQAVMKSSTMESSLFKKIQQCGVVAVAKNLINDQYC